MSLSVLHYEPSHVQILEYEHDRIHVLYTQVNGNYFTMIISMYDLDLLYTYNWSLLSTGYIMTGEGIYLHRLIMLRVSRELGCIADPQFNRVDHKNRNTVDNSRGNLRWANKSLSAANRRKFSNNTSGFKGVRPSQNGERWIASITINKRQLHLGTFDTREEAYAAYCTKAKELFGEFACLE